jgi:hypothetical protein
LQKRQSRKVFVVGDQQTELARGEAQDETIWCSGVRFCNIGNVMTCLPQNVEYSGFDALVGEQSHR